MNNLNFEMEEQTTLLPISIQLGHWNIAAGYHDRRDHQTHRKLHENNGTH